MSLFDSGVRPAIDAHLLEEAAKVRDYGNYWSASSAGYCMRKVIFERLGVPHIAKEDDARKQRVFSSGHIFHDWIQGITKAAGLSIASEVELQDEDLMIRGHFDDLILIKEMSEPTVFVKNGPTQAPPFKEHLILYDYKTVNSRSFLWAKKNGNAMSYYHKMQLGSYMYMLRKNPGAIVADQNPLIPSPNPVTISTDGNPKLRPPTTQEFNLTEARILKISKDDLRMSEQQLLWSDSLEYEVELYWKTLNKLWQKQLIPKCTCADHEGGFMAKEKFNPFFFEGEPCSLALYEKFKQEKVI